jgi:uncharacterized delta-60 repeat protein
VILVLSGLLPASQAASGDLDLTFGSNGKVLTDFGGTTDYVFTTAMQPDGKIVAIGQAKNTSGSNVDITVIRYNTDGSFDQTFGNGGKVQTHLSSSWDAAYGLALQADGKIVLAGECDQCGGGLDFALVRYLNSLPPTPTPTPPPDEIPPPAPPPTFFVPDNPPVPEDSPPPNTERGSVIHAARLIYHSA